MLSQMHSVCFRCLKNIFYEKMQILRFFAQNEEAQLWQTLVVMSSKARLFFHLATFLKNIKIALIFNNCYDQT